MKKVNNFLIIILSIILVGCKGGGIFLAFGKPQCIPKAFASKRYTCINGDFIAIDEEYRCVPPLCPPLSTEYCGWGPYDIIRDRSATFVYAMSYDRDATGYYVATCKTDNSVSIEVKPKEPEKDNDLPPNTPIENSNLEPINDPRLTRPRECTQNSNYRLEEDKVSFDNSLSFATSQTCNRKVYIDQSASNASDKMHKFRTMQFSIYCDNYYENTGSSLLGGYAIGFAILNQKPISSTINIADIVYRKLRISDLHILLQVVNGKKAAFIVEVNLPVEGLYNGQQLYAAVIGGNLAGGSSSQIIVGESWPFEVATSYNTGYLGVNGKTYTTNERCFNIQAFSNQAGGSFSSDITNVSYNGTFKEHLEKIWNNDIHSKVNFQINTIPKTLVDENGNGVLWLDDFPFIKGTGERKHVDINNSLDLLSLTEFQQLIENWKYRLVKYNKILGGTSEEIKDLYNSDGTLNTTRITLTRLNKISFDSRVYSNLATILLVNRFVIYNSNSELNSEMSSQLDEYITHLFSPVLYKEFSLTPFGVTFRLKEHVKTYSPITIVYNYQIERQYLTDPVRRQGRIIKVGIHELGHAWFKDEVIPLNQDPGCEEFNDHIKRNFLFNNQLSEEGYYCIMKQSERCNSAPISFYNKQMDLMKFSPGILELFRNRFAITK